MAEGGPLPEGRAARTARTRLRAEPSAVLDLEAFVDGLSFLAPRDRCRMKLAADEIFDNLVRHATPLVGDRVTLRATLRRDGILLGFYFRSAAFATFASNPDDLEPLFDPEHRRWRRIGLVMCRNLCADLCMRHGSRLDRILLRFEPEEAPSLLSFPDRGAAK